MAELGTADPAKPPSPSYAVALWMLLALFVCRVVGQVLVVFFDVGFLPPATAWQSGLMGYPWLLTSQIAIILVFGKICLDFSRGRGVSLVPRRWLGQLLLVFGGLYLLAMVTRYVVRMALYSQERWTGGTIPTFFHWVLAGFLLVFGAYHWRRGSGEARISGTGAYWWAVAMFAAAVLAVWIGSRMAHLPPPGPTKS